MRLILDRTDIVVMLIAKLRDEGHAATDVRLPPDITGEVEVSSEPIPKKPDTVQLLVKAMDELLTRMNALTERVEELETLLPGQPPPQSDVRPQGFNHNKQKNGKHRHHGQPQTRVDAVKRQIKAEENLIGDPRGSKLVEGERHTGPNESEEFPG